MKFIPKFNFKIGKLMEKNDDTDFDKKYLDRIKDISFQPIFIMLPIEIASEIARTFSLSFRLFGNIMGEEIIIAILFLISPFILPVPMMLFSIFTGVLQAYIFTLLSCVYIGGAVKAHATS